MTSGPIIVMMDAGELVACRICLVGDGNLYDIHEWGLDQAFIKLMGLPLMASLPQYLCSWCRALLIKAWRLRARCHRADALMHEMLNKKLVTTADILTVDRSAYKLTHTLTQNLSTGVQYHFAHTQSNASGQHAPCCIGEQPCESGIPSIVNGDESDHQLFKSNQPCIIIENESDKQPSNIIGEISDKQPCKPKQPHIIIGKKSDKEPCIIIGDKRDKTVKQRSKYNGPCIIIGDNCNNNIIIVDKQQCIAIGKKSDKKPCIIIGDKSDKTDKQPSDQPWIINGDDSDNQLCDSDQPCIPIDDESDNDEQNGKTNQLTYKVVDGGDKESDLNYSDINCDIADHMNDSDEEIDMNTRGTQAVGYDNEANLASAEVKKKRVKVRETDEILSLPTIEECEEHAKKHNFKMQRLTDEEMVKEMERRKVSERFVNRKYKCNFCHRGFMTSSTFDNHMKKYHNPKKSHNECELCRVSYPAEYWLRQHMRNSHELRFTCAKCGYIVWDKNECIRHAIRHDTRRCQFCEKGFRNGSTFAWHMRVAHSVENAARGSCEICGEIFSGGKGLRAHKLLKHNRVDEASPDLQCRRCRVLFDNEEALLKHLELNSDKCDLSMSACTACGADCAGVDALLRHMRDAHRQQVHSCGECERLFLTETSLSTHIDRVHRGIPPQQPVYIGPPTRQLKKKPLKRDRMCELCGRVFVCNALLKTHQMTHTGERPFKCTLCPKAYVTAMELREHRDMHAGIRKYRCKECPKTFFRQASIYKHRLVHTGERPFKCHICNKTFNLSGSLVSHIKYVHMKMEPPPRRRRGLAAVQSRLRDDA